MRKLKAYLFPAIMLLTSLGMAAIAAFISVSGLGKLFAGAGATVLLMTGIIEFSKVVITTYLHKSDYSAKNLLLNIPLTIITVIIMGVTSLGVYGFLANGYTITAGELDKNKGEIALVENRIKNHETKIQGLQSQKENYNDRASKLTNLRSQQETRVDSLYARRWYKSARKVEAQIKEADSEIKSLMKKSSDADSLIQLENESIGELRNEIIDLNNSDVNAEIGPLMYIANLTGLPMDNVINYIILVLIFIFDPAAVLMLIAANHMFDNAKKKLEEPEEEKIENKSATPNGEDEGEFKDLEGMIPTEEITWHAAPATPVVAFRESVSGSTVQSVDETDPIEDKVIITAYSGVGNTITSENSFEDIVYSSNEKSEVESKAEKFFEKKEKKKEEFLEMIEEKNKELEGSQEEEIKIFNPGQDEEVVEEEVVEEEAEETLYTKFLDILYKDGEVEKGGTLPSFQEFKDTLDERKEEFEDLLVKEEMKYDDKLIRDFISTCNLLMIIDTHDSKRVAKKSLDKAKEVMFLIEKEDEEELD